VGCSAVICSGDTQASADWLRLCARPTTVNRLPPRITSALLSGGYLSESAPGAGWLSTTSPGAVGQRPRQRFRRSTGPPGSARPTTVSGPCGPGPPASVRSSVTWPNGPAMAATPIRWPASCASVTLARSYTATACGPCCLAKARSNGAEEASSRASATTIVVVESRTTRPMTNVCTRRRRTAARAARHTALMPIPDCARGRSARRPARPRGWRTASRAARRG